MGVVLDVQMSGYVDMQMFCKFMTTAEVLHHLQQRSSEKYLAGMLRFGVDNTKAYGTPVPELRKVAKTIKKDHALALELWDTGIHEARILATMIDDPAAGYTATNGCLGKRFLCLGYLRPGLR